MTEVEEILIIKQEITEETMPVEAPCEASIDQENKPHDSESETEINTEDFPKISEVPAQQATEAESSQHSELSDEEETIFQMPARLAKKRTASTKLEMNTRRMKKQRIETEIAEEESDQEVEQGASCLKYEFVNKRDKNGKEKKVLMAMRCSIRNKVMGFEVDSTNPLQDLDKTNIDMSFEYNP